MPLKLTLKPNEKVLIGNAVLENGASKSEIVVLNRVPVLRQKDIIRLEDADTVAKQLYCAILNMYVDADAQGRYHDIYFSLLRVLIDMVVDEKGLDLLMGISQRIIEGDHYGALKLCRKLIRYEAEVMTNG